LRISAVFDVVEEAVGPRQKDARNVQTACQNVIEMISGTLVIGSAYFNPVVNGLVGPSLAVSALGVAV
jgi:hypothetical protein